MLTDATALEWSALITGTAIVVLMIGVALIGSLRRR